MIRILSDLHLGHDACRIGRINDLAPLLEGVETLLINGDGREQLARRFVEKGAAMWADLEKLCRERGVKLLAQRGNHDPHVEGRGYEYFFGERAIVHHGDAIYPRVSPWSREVWFHRKMIREFIENHWRDDFNLDERLEFARDLELSVPQVSQPRVKNPIARALKLLAWPPHRPLLVLAIWANAGRRIAGWGMQFTPQSKLIVCGHFHRTQSYRAGDGRWILLTGPFTALGKASCVDFDEVSKTVIQRPVSMNDQKQWLAGEEEMRLIWSEEKKLWCSV